MKITIFVLSALLGVGFQSCHHEVITISDANPIQFWINGVETFNQKEVCSIAPVCFCQKFGCDDDIRIQFKDSDPSKGYRIKVYSDSSANLFTADFVRRIVYEPSPILQFTNVGFDSSLTGWFNFDGSNRSLAEAFLWVSGKAVADGTGSGTGDGFENSKYFAVARTGGGSFTSWPPGTYTVRVVATNNSSGAADAIGVAAYGMQTSSNQTSLSSSSSANFANGVYTAATVTFTTYQYWNYFAFAFTRLGGGGSFDIKLLVDSISILSGPGAEDYAIYDYEFTPSDKSICDESVQLKIYGQPAEWSDAITYNIGDKAYVTATGIVYECLQNNNIDDYPPDTIYWKISDDDDTDVKAYSDCVKITSNTDCTNLIQYSNSNDFAGLFYDEESPEISFQIRLSSVFFHEVFPDSFEGIDLSNSQTVQLWSELKAKRKLDLDYMPYYMYRKLGLILAHDSVYIDSKYWIKLDPLVPVDGNKRYPLKIASVLLTEKDFIERNVL